MFPFLAIPGLRRIFAFALSLLFATTSVALAQGGSATISGSVTDVASGLSVGGASVSLQKSGHTVATTTTDGSGVFHFDNQAAAVYRIIVSANGFGTTSSDDVILVPSQTAISVAINVSRQTDSSAQLRTIGSVRSSSTLGGGLQRTSTVSQDISSATLQKYAYANIGEGITTLPGVNNQGHGSSIGDDTSLSLRGFDPSESQTLLDGHPIGPIGVGGGGFNYQISPFYVIKNTQVTFGAGALGLYGTDATGGAIDMQTISPTRQREITLTQGIGTLGRLQSAFTATGTLGKLGYAVGGATQGLYGDFKPQVITQTGNLGFDISPSNVTANTHSVSGAYSLRDALVKLQYEIVPGTVATITGYTARSRDDKSGVGDNDYQPYSEAVKSAQGNLGSNGCAANLVGVKISDAGDISCQTPEQAALTSYGPSGGGPNPFQEIVNQDYHGRLTTNYLGNSIAIDGYIDTFNLNYSRNQSSQDPTTGRYTGGFYQNLYHTNGFLISDDLARGKNDFGFGYFAQHQTYDNRQFDTTNLVIVPNPQLFLATNNIFLRDTYTAAPWLTVYTNVYYKLLSTTGADTVDPRATLLLRPTPHDVVRLIAGKTDGEPSASLASTVLNNTPSNINANSVCQNLYGLSANSGNMMQAPGSVGIGQVAASGLQQETASDFEATYGHSFANGSQVQIGGYVQRAVNLVGSTTVPVPAGLVPDGLLQQYYARIQTACGQAYVGTLQDLSLSQATNSALSGLYRGIELTGRAVITRNLALNFTYDLQHAQIFGYTDAELMNSPTTINGAQVGGTPLNHGSLGAEFNNHHGFNASIDGYYFGINNGYHRPAYGYANAAFGYTFSQTGTEIALGLNNAFNNAAQRYGYFNQGVTPAVNSFYTAGTVGSEEFGLVPRALLFSLTQHIK